MPSDLNCVMGQDHAWERFVADEGRGFGGGTPYSFCRQCGVTLYWGQVFKPRTARLRN